ncbi:uncharacterized protein SOCE26_099900 [Sorangium cellulosum]|uniref:Uncharacterized protein n=1 Tax=Sorangium cellulosum TaxID=56 RepID=A0A2L0FA52_SORCE|nr:hypothetical protein [Sorangium cellulosum]AUX48455.1 uncharacterized protein SOCE26_099900 [Sorangium cellulosum]
MAQIYGAVEFRIRDEWYDVIYISSLLLQHCDLNGCLFGVDNYAGFVPLFANRGIPADCSENMRQKMDVYLDDESWPSWVLYSELIRVDWDECALSRDCRISEYVVCADGKENFVTKWLNKLGCDWVRQVLETEQEARSGDRVFRRPVLRRADAIADTEFGLLMKLMACLADRFGADGVRLVVWFG